MSSQDLAESTPAETIETEAESTGVAAEPDEAEPPQPTESETSTALETPCPVVDSLEQIGSRWRLVVLHEL